MTKSILNKRTWFLSLLLQVLLFSVSAQQAEYIPDVEKKIKEFENSLGLWVNIEGAKNKYNLQERMAFYRVNGVSIAFIKDYKMEWARGFGWADSAEQRPVTTESLFQAASISKSLNGVGVLKLVQDGRLDLYADINEYLRSWKFPYDSLSKGKKITTANLLSHTAGLTVSGFPGYEMGLPLPSRSQILDGVSPANTKAVRSAFEPGIKFQYSGGGTTISQTLIEDITGKGYEAYMWDNVLKPLGMHSSTFDYMPGKEQATLRATAYFNNGKALTGKYHLYPEQAAAALWTNPTDLSKYIIETQLALQGRSSKVLSQEMTKLRLTPYVDSVSALGVRISKRGTQTYFGHSGGNAGFRSQYFGSIDGGNGVVVMVNSDNGTIISEILSSVATVYNWNGFYQPKVKKVMLVDSSILKKYVGNYTIDRLTVSILMEGDRLVLKQEEQNMNVYFTSDTDFFVMEVPNGDYSFVKDATNHVEALQIKRGSNTTKLTKIL